MTRSDVEVRSQREGSGSNNIFCDETRNTQIPTSSSRSHEVEAVTGSSPMRTIPQLDGPTSIHTTRNLEDIRTEPKVTQHSPEITREGYPDESDSDPHNNRRPQEGRRPHGRRQHQERSGRPPNRNGGPLIMEDPLMMEDPQIMEDPLEMDEIQDALEDKDHQVHQGLLDQYALL